MSKHLEYVHKKTVSNATKEANQRKLTDIFFNATKKRKSNEEECRSLLQYSFNRRVALWMCRDLLPFNTVTKDGFKDFWNSTNDSPNETLPCRATVSVSALDDLYDIYRKKFLEVLSATPEHGTITFDCWTDAARRAAYVTYTYHYMHNWAIKTAVLKTSVLARPHTGERLKEDFEETIREYQLSNKKLTAVTDGGANVKKACELLYLYRSGCIGHIVHNVIMVDLMKNTAVQVIVELWAHIRQIQQKLTYKFSELKSIHDAENHEEAWRFLLEFQENGDY